MDETDSVTPATENYVEIYNTYFCNVRYILLAYSQGAKTSAMYIKVRNLGFLEAIHDVSERHGTGQW